MARERIERRSPRYLLQSGMGMSMDALRAIDEFIAEQMALGRMPGLALAVVHGSDVVLKGYGHADVERSVPMTEDSRVVIGSTTKALTALAMMQLVERGSVELDAPVQRHLPGFRVADPAAGAKITVRHILTHTAGLPPTPMDGPSFLYSDDDRPDAGERYIQELRTASLVWEPGAGFLYSNDGYVLAGQIIEVISGLSYEEYMARRVLEPIGIGGASFAAARPPDDAAVPYDYDGSPRAFPSFFPHSRVANAAGMLMMTAAEAARWLRCVLGGGEIDGRRVVSTDGMARLTSPQALLSQAARAAGRQQAEAYAFGWMTGDLAGRRLVSHGGSAITMGSNFSLLPDEGIGVGVLANSGTEVSAIVAEGVLRLLTGGSPARTFPRVALDSRPDPAQWRRLEGIYAATAPQNAVTSLLPIELAGDRLRARTFPGDDRRRSGDFYFLPGEENQFVLFGRGKTGGIATFDGETSPIRATVQGAPLRQISAHLHSGYVLTWGD